MSDLEYEPSDVNARKVVKAALGLLGMIALAAAVALGVFTLLKKREQASDAPVPRLARHEPGRLPTTPRLQSMPTVDLQQLNAGGRQQLESYGWVDPQAGVVHIPVEEAMRIYAARQAAHPAVLPSASPSPPAAARLPPAPRPSRAPGDVP